MSYRRVLPRDFFNESKLLKCMGRLSLELLDSPLMREHIGVDESAFEAKCGFHINQTIDGAIWVANYSIYLHRGGKIFLQCGLNSKLNYPLEYEYVTTDEVFQGYVFNETGEFTWDFVKFVEGEK